MTFSYGATTSYLANLDQTLAVIGIKNSGEMTAQILLSAMLAGLVSSFIFIRKVKTTLQYKSVLSLCKFYPYLRFIGSFYYVYYPTDNFAKETVIRLGFLLNGWLRWIFLDSYHCDAYGVFFWGRLSPRWRISHRILIRGKSNIWVCFWYRISRFDFKCPQRR